MAILGMDCTFSVGAKQTKIAIEKGEAVKVFIAEDADKKLVNPIADRCNELGIPIEMAPSMNDLGKTCGIQVGAAAAAMVRKLF